MREAFDFHNPVCRKMFWNKMLHRSKAELTRWQFIKLAWSDTKNNVCPVDRNKRR